MMYDIERTLASRNKPWGEREPVPMTMRVRDFKCEACGRPFQSKSPSAKRCAGCREIRKKETRNAARLQEARKKLQV
jgi:hypothetical protein